MFPLVLIFFILLRLIADFPISQSLHERQLLSEPLLVLNQCNDKCGELKVPFPFHLNSSCGMFSNAFQLSCENSTTLFLNIDSEKYRVLEFYSDGLLVDFPGSFSCRQYNDLNSFGFEGNDNFAVSSENVIGLYDCEDSSLCKAECEAIDLPGCDGSGSSSPACCYPLSDHSVWRLGDKFSVFSKFGCRGFSSWVVLRTTTNSAKRGVKLEWAIPRNSSKAVCASNAYIANATAVKAGVRCLCQDGFVGDGFAKGIGCIKSCIKDRREAYGNECNNKRHSDKKLVIIGGVLSSVFIIASFIALFCLLKRPVKPGAFDPDEAHFQSNVSFRKACTTRLFTYHELEEATKGFEEAQKLVDGANGAIYAGVLADGSHIAVHKIQCENERDLIQVLSQIEVLSAVLHRNMARLLGCCIDLAYMPLVVYEYPTNGTLEEHLHQKREPKTSLEWHKRLNIAAETANVLSFLHYEISPPIFHRDLKPGSIFLGEDFSVKIAGFGLLIPTPRDSHKSHEISRFQKNDVCDLGIVILEIIAGSNRLDLPSVALQKIRTGKLEEIVDPLLYYHEQPSSRKEQIEIVADLATRCLLFGGDGKLGMVDVARELGHITKDGVEGGGSKRGPALEETFSNSSLLQMISMSPDSIYLP
ncbi:Tyrosine-protein kinase [Trema orientale]|uniref:Tyrosine-protein kinase n=1 Tax=Trema orientale TaxID=63057 RepID=A0A2P5FHC6_TREOI|nr:Tyrosine-protein kinase [Trema orientale]